MIKHLVSNVLWGHFRSAVQAFEVLCWYHMPQHFEAYSTFKKRSAVQSAVAKTQSTQHDGRRDSTTALLSLKNYISVYVYEYACSYRRSYSWGFKVLFRTPAVSA